LELCKPVGSIGKVMCEGFGSFWRLQAKATGMLHCWLSCHLPVQFCESYLLGLDVISSEWIVAVVVNFLLSGGHSVP
jgi:hypothetical protein